MHHHLNVFYPYKRINVKVKVSVLEICLVICKKKLESNPKSDIFSSFCFYKNIKDIQSDNLLLFEMYYI